MDLEVWCDGNWTQEVGLGANDVIRFRVSWSPDGAVAETYVNGTLRTTRTITFPTYPSCRTQATKEPAPRYLFPGRTRSVWMGHLSGPGYTGVRATECVVETPDAGVADAALVDASVGGDTSVAPDGPGPRDAGVQPDGPAPDAPRRDGGAAVDADASDGGHGSGGCAWGLGPSPGSWPMVALILALVFGVARRRRLPGPR